MLLSDSFESHICVDNGIDSIKPDKTFVVTIIVVETCVIRIDIFSEGAHNSCCPLVADTQHYA